MFILVTLDELPGKPRERAWGEPQQRQTFQQRQKLPGEKPAFLDHAGVAAHLL